jgi:hypothetical protein
MTSKHIQREGVVTNSFRLTIFGLSQSYITISELWYILKNHTFNLHDRAIKLRIGLRRIEMKLNKCNDELSNVTQFALHSLMVTETGDHGQRVQLLI